MADPTIADMATSAWALTPAQVATLIADSSPTVVAAIHAAGDQVFTAALVESRGETRFDVVTRPVSPGTRWIRLDEL